MIPNNFSEIQNKYPQIKKVLNTYRNLTTKIAKQKNRKIFLLHCRSNNLIPNALKIKTEHINFTHTRSMKEKRKKIEHALNKFQFTILNLLISDCHQTIKEIEIQQQNINKKIKNTLHLQDAETFMKLIDTEQEKTHQKIKRKNIDKLEKLKKKRKDVLMEEVIIQESWYTNMSNTEIPSNILNTLAMGPKHAENYHNNQELPIKNIIANIETNINNFSTEEKDDIRAKITNTITNFNNTRKMNRNRHTKENNGHVTETKKFLKENPQLIVLKPDKSNKTVIMNRIDYNNKILQLINDPTTYKEMKKNPTKQLQDKNNKLIDNLLKKEYIDIQTSKQLKINNSQSPKIYGLPKLHKQNCPLRPIVSCIQSPFYKLSKYLAQILKNVTCDTEYYIKDSFSFKKFLNETVLPPNFELISLDVISLYTNIPLDLAKTTITEKWSQIQQYTNIPLKDFLYALELIFTNNYFEYEKKFYNQTDGCAMGHPISSVIAQLVMEKLETDVLEGITIKPYFFKRYVDDCILAIPKNTENDILNQFNQYNSKIQFTLEKSTQNVINFLDMSLKINNQNKIETSWYTKPTWSGRYTNFHSKHPMSHKKSVIIGIIDRAIKLSSCNHREKAINKAKDILKKNSYPEKLINQITKKRIHLYYNSEKRLSNNENITKKYISLPYVPKLSEKIQNIFKNNDIEIAHKVTNNYNDLFTKLKTKIPTDYQTHCIYEIPCNNCDGKYIGQTMQYLHKRINQHKNSVKHVTNCNETALSKHAKTEHHNFNFEQTKIIDKEQNNKSRMFLEMIHIKRNKNSINDRTDIQELSKIYNNVIK